MKRQGRSFSTDFKHEAACLVMDQGYSISEASRSLGAGETAFRRRVQQLKLERGGGTPVSKALDRRAKAYSGVRSPGEPAGAGESHIKKGCRSLDVGRDESYVLIDQSREHESVEMVCEVFDIHRSCYYTCRERRKRVDVQRVILKAKVNQVFKKSRGAAGSRTIKSMLNEAGH